MENPTTKEELEEIFTFNIVLVGTEGAIQDEGHYEVYTKEQLLKRLEEILPEKHNYSLISAYKKEDKGL